MPDYYMSIKDKHTGRVIVKPVRFSHIELKLLIKVIGEILTRNSKRAEWDTNSSLYHYTVEKVEGIAAEEINNQINKGGIII